MNKLMIVAVVAFCTTLQGASPNMSSAQPPSRASAAAQTAPAVSLKQDMRKLWTDRVVWTRDYIIAAVGALSDGIVKQFPGKFA